MKFPRHSLPISLAHLTPFLLVTFITNKHYWNLKTISENKRGGDTRLVCLHKLTESDKEKREKKKNKGEKKYVFCSFRFDKIGPNSLQVMK
jgi:hypothetical protein